MNPTENELGDLQIIWKDDRVWIVDTGPGKTRIFELTGNAIVTWNHDG